MATYIQTGKLLAPNDRAPPEDSADMGQVITFDDIVNYFPYLKNLEDQSLSPFDFYNQLIYQEPLEAIKTDEEYPTQELNLQVNDD